MGTEHQNDFDHFIHVQKQKLAKEREALKNGKMDEPESKQKPSERMKWEQPAIDDLQFKVNNESQEQGLVLGQYESKRKQLENERKREYQELLSKKQVQEGRGGATEQPEAGGLFAKLGQYEQKRKVLDVERKNEYNKLQTTMAARGQAKTPHIEDPVRHNSTNNPSSEPSKSQQRNAEYNQFLRDQEIKFKNRFAEKKGLTSELAPQNVPPDWVNPPVTSRKGWGTPSYEEMLDEKRRQETNYRRYADPEYSNPPAGMKTGGDAFRQRNTDEGKRYDDLEREYERKKVKFHVDKSITDDASEFYDWDMKDRGRSQSFYREPPARTVDPYDRVKSAPPEEEPNYGTGLNLGSSERASAARRKKEIYRKELEQQMQADNQARKREKQGFLENGYPKNPPPAQTTSLPQRGLPPSRLNPAPSILDDRRPLASILNERRDLTDTSPRTLFSNYPAPGAPGVLDKGFTGLYEPSSLSSRFPQYPAAVPHLDLGYGRTPQDDAYHYYGSRDPLTADPYPSVAGLQTSQFPYSGALTAPSGQALGNSYFSDSPKQPNAQVPRAGSVLPFGNQEDDKQKKLQYQIELKRQMEEKEIATKAKKAQQDAYERKLEEDIANYNPFGRGGGGAPMRDTSGNIIADLRSMNKSNTGATPRIALDQKNTPSQPTQNLTPRYESQSVLGGASNNLPTSPTFARGGNGIFGAPKSEEQKTATEKYKEELKRQIDDKKRKADEDKRKVREEEEREIRRLEEDRLKIQREFEAEQAKQKAKEEELRKKNEEMKIQAETKKKDAERVQEEKEHLGDQKRQNEPTATAKTEDRSAQSQPMVADLRPDSPPIPTLRSKTQPVVTTEPKAQSPLLPTTRSKTEPEAKPFTRNTSRPAQEPTTVKAPIATTNRPETRAPSAEVLNQLANMRKQLQQERQRVEHALEKQKNTVDVYDPRHDDTDSKSIDIFEVARQKNPVAVRRQAPESAGSHAVDTFNHVKAGKPGTTSSLLQSDSAFIDDSGMRATFPEDFDALAVNQQARRKRRERYQPAQPAKDTESVISLDPGKLNQKNQDRLRKLKDIAGDDMSVYDPDDIIDRFMNKQHYRAPSGQTLTDETWMRAGSR